MGRLATWGRFKRTRVNSSSIKAGEPPGDSGQGATGATLVTGNENTTMMMMMMMMTALAVPAVGQNSMMMTTTVQMTAPRVENNMITMTTVQVTAAGITGFYQNSTMTKFWASCFAFRSAQSITTIKLTLRCN